MSETAPPRLTAHPEYTDRLLRDGGVWWKRLLDIRDIYGRHLRRLQPGFTLDVGCGLGRNLVHLRGEGVGIDHNLRSVEVCRERGLRAFTPEEFRQSEFAAPGRFDSLLLAHVLEHMTLSDAVSLIAEHLPYIQADGQVILITPQEYGYRADPTHIEFVDPPKLDRILHAAGVTPQRHYSFPLPHLVFGQIFRHNEFVAVGRVGTGRP